MERQRVNVEKMVYRGEGLNVSGTF